MSTFVKTTSTAATLEVKRALDVRLFIAFLRRLIDGASGKDAVDQFVRILHLANGLVIFVLAELRHTPML